MSKSTNEFQSSINPILNFYGLASMPFGKDIHHSNIFKTSCLKNAQAMLELGINTEDILLISGPIGCGKSVVIRSFLNLLDLNSYTPVYLNGNIRSSTDLLKLILKGLFIEPPFAPFKTKVLYNKSIQDMNKKPIIILDDAQDLFDSALLSLKSLVNFENDSKNKVTFILSGQPEIRDRLSYALFLSIKQRIKLDIVLTPMTLEETCAYIDHSLKICGRPSSLFSDNAKSEIFKISSGLPRAINTLCFKALIQGTIKKIDIIDSGNICFDSF